jgi:Cu(I)/Ag(I) efflux system membrane protein CusA/SilA
MQAVESAFGGMAITTSVEGTLRYPVRIRYLRERRDDADELLQLQRARGRGGGRADPARQPARLPTVHTLEFPEGAGGAGRGDPAAALLARLPLAAQRNLTLLGPRRAEITLPAAKRCRPSSAPTSPPAGSASPARVRARPASPTPWARWRFAPRAASAPSTCCSTPAAAARSRWCATPTPACAPRSQDGRLELPPGATYRWVGRYEQKLKADGRCAGIIAVSMAVMVVLIYVGTRSWLITAIIILCNALVTTAGGFFFVWLWGVEMTTAVVVGFLVLLGVMFNDGILLGTYIQEQFRTHPGTVAEVHRRVFTPACGAAARPIMTNATTLLSLIPVLWATGPRLRADAADGPAGGGWDDFRRGVAFPVPVFFTWYWERRLARGG